jgi:hypothetical protein
MDIHEELKVSVLCLFKVWNGAMRYFAEAVQKDYGIEKVEVLAAPLNDEFKRIIQQIKDGEYPPVYESACEYDTDEVLKQARREVGKELHEEVLKQARREVGKELHEEVLKEASKALHY